VFNANLRSIFSNIDFIFKLLFNTPCDCRTVYYHKQ